MWDTMKCAALTCPLDNVVDGGHLYVLVGGDAVDDLASVRPRDFTTAGRAPPHSVGEGQVQHLRRRVGADQSLLLDDVEVRPPLLLRYL